MTTRMVLLIPLILAQLTSLPAIAGVFVGTVDCTSTGGAGNFCAQGRDGTLDQNLVPERAIMHPPGWDGTQSTVDVKVCVNAPAEFIEPTERAIATWNALNAAPANCPRCLLVEQIDDGEDEHRVNEFHAESVILHELGHCALGLGHSNLFFDDPRDDDCNPQDPDCDPERIRPTSFSASYDGVKIGVQPGPDGIRGSKDDRQDSIGGGTATNVHWFRTEDNDPVVIDGAVIDRFSFAVDTDGLPSGSNWPANANRASAAQLGMNGTQAVMYSNLARDSAWLSPSADEVNMVELGKTGADVESGGADDYAVTLTYVESCSLAQVMVRVEEAGPGSLGGCDVKVFETPISPPPPVPVHYTIAPAAGSFSTLVLDDDVNWNTGSVVTVFDDGFEAGDTSAWSATVP